jgi:hypothetical protein
MSDFTPPGTGWAELPPDAAPPAEATEIVNWTTRDGQARTWALTPPKPLPTAVGTVIRIDTGPAAGTWLLDAMGWLQSGALNTLVRADDLQADVTDWTIIAEPRAITAAAVLADVRAATIASGIGTVDLAPIAATYGATLPQADA